MKTRNRHRARTEVPHEIVPNSGLSCHRQNEPVLRLAATRLDRRLPVETVEIEASWPKLNKNGRLRAIRRSLSAH